MAQKYLKMFFFSPVDFFICKKTRILLEVNDFDLMYF